MKNILIIDGAENCAYDIFAATDAEFALLFPAGGQDIAFIDEVVIKPARRGVSKALKNLWTRPVEKKDAHGIHGTIFYQLNNKKIYYPNRRNQDLDGWARHWFHAGNEANDIGRPIVEQVLTRG